MIVLGKKYQYRPMQTEDINDIMEIEKACFPDPWSAQQFFFEVINAGRECHILTHKGHIVAYLMFWLVADEINLNNIAVRSDYRERQIGSYLMEQLELFAQEHNATTITLEVHEKNGPGLALYRKMGYIQVGQRSGYYEYDHGDALILTKTLTKETE